MKNIKYLLLIILCIVIFPINANAIIVTASRYDYTPTGITFSEDNKKAEAKVYQDGRKYISISGTDSTVYIVDTGYNFPSGTKYNCSQSNDPGLVYLMNKGDGVTTADDYYKYQLAFRFYSIPSGFNKSTLSDQHNALLRYYTYANNVQPGDIIEKYVYGSLVYAAYQETKEAVKHRNDTRSSYSTSSTNISFVKESDINGVVTYQVKTASDLGQIKFTCENCQIISGETLNGNGKIVVKPVSGSRFRINAYFKPQGVQICNPVNGSIGNLPMIVTKLSGASIGGEGDPAGGGIDTSGEPTQYFNGDSVSTEESITDKCTSKTIPLIDDRSHNCCLDGSVSEISEPQLDQLVCKFEQLPVVDKYWKVVGADAYHEENSGLNENYCEVLCTERVHLEQPKEIVGTAGMYFELGKTSKNTKSVYIEGAKRCRLLIDYDKWHKEYKQTVLNEIAAYNEYQKQIALSKVYEKTIATSELVHGEKITVNCTTVPLYRSCTYTTYSKYETVDANGIRPGEPGYTTTYAFTTGTGGCSSKEPTPSDRSNFLNRAQIESYTVKDAVSITLPDYRIYTFSNGLNEYPHYYNYELDTSKEANHLGLDVKLTSSRANGKIPTTDHISYSKKEAYGSTIFTKLSDLDLRIHNLNQMLTEVEGTQNSCGFSDSYGHYSHCTTERSRLQLSCGRTSSRAESYGHENVEGKKGTYDAAAAEALTRYNNACDQAVSLEKIMDDCQRWFEPGHPGTDVNVRYHMNPKLGVVTYDQVYLDENGTSILDSMPIGFSNVKCTVTGPDFTSTELDVLTSPVSSEEYHSGIEVMRDFKHNDNPGWNRNPILNDGNYMHTSFSTQKVFVRDGKYNASCYWEESENETTTKVHTGDINAGKENYTVQRQQYPLHLTTLSGVYELKWDLSGIGSQRAPYDGIGKFDGYLASKKTCAGEDGSVALQTCIVKVDNKLIPYKGCPGPNPPDSPDDCEAPDDPPNKTVEAPLNFKIVDPVNLFPSYSESRDGDKAYNWKKTSYGQTVETEIRTRGANDETYSPTRKSFEFILSPAKMKEIRKYNASRVKQGGYGDSDLECDSDDTPRPCNRKSEDDNTCYREISITNCRSRFVRNQIGTSYATDRTKLHMVSR